jgi:glucokinase
MNDIVIAADLGGTNLRMAVVARDGSVLHRTKLPTRGDAGGDVLMEEIVEAASESMAAVTDRKVIAMGIAVPATIDFAAGILRNSPNVPALNGLNIPKILSERLGIKAILDNDGTAAAVGEHWLGATRGTGNSIFVTLGTGVGGGLIFDGKPYRGIDGTAGEIGHIGVEKEGHPCGCGSRGCVEQYSSATAIVRIAKELEPKHPNSRLLGKSNLSASEIYEAGLDSDSLAREVFSVMGAYLGMALADLVNVLNPEMIVIGGGVAGAWDLFIGDTQEEIAKRSFREPAERVKLIRAKLGDDAGILGAARLAFSAAS